MMANGDVLVEMSSLFHQSSSSSQEKCQKDSEWYGSIDCELLLILKYDGIPDCKI